MLPQQHSTPATCNLQPAPIIQLQWNARACDLKEQNRSNFSAVSGKRQRGSLAIPGQQRACNSLAVQQQQGQLSLHLQLCSPFTKEGRRRCCCCCLGCCCCSCLHFGLHMLLVCTSNSNNGSSSTSNTSNAFCLFALPTLLAFGVACLHSSPCPAPACARPLAPHPTVSAPSSAPSCLY